MKHALAALLLALFLFPSIAMGVTVKYEDLVKLESLHYYRFTGEPFTGKVRETHKGHSRTVREMVLGSNTKTMESYCQINLQGR